MKYPILLFSVSVLTATLTSGAAYMKIGDIKGEATDSNHQGWIDVLSVSGLDPTEAGSRAAKESSQKKVVVIRELDKSSTKLAESCAPGARMGDVTISQGSKTFVIENATVVSCVTKGNKQTITLRSGEINVKPIRLETRGAAAQPSQPTRAAKPVAPESSPAGGKAQDYNSSRSNTTS